MTNFPRLLISYHILADMRRETNMESAEELAVENRVASSISAARHPVQSKCIIFAITYINKFLYVQYIPAIYFTFASFPDPGRSSRYIYIYIRYICTISIAFPAAVRCYTIIWLNQSLPLIRSGISGGNYWNWLFELEIFGVTLRSAEGFIEFCLVIL